MGAAFSWLKEAFPLATQFTPEDIPDLSGKVMIVTGANTGVGKETAKALLQHNAKVYIAARNANKAKQAIEDLKKETGKEALILQLDLSDLRSIKAAAEEFASKEKALHVLFNNAGVMTPPIDMLTAQGYDLQFGTNVLGHFYFTKLLVPVLLEGAKSTPDSKARVVNTSSSGSWFANSVNFNTLKDTSARKKAGGHYLYCQSKLGNVLLSTELARKYGDQGIVSTALNPGNLKSELTRHISAAERFLLGLLILYPVPLGALTQLYAGTSAEGVGFNGKYLIPWARMGTANPAGEDPTLAAELWRWMEEQVETI
ncbi:hypothetical protein D9619_004230 [Psilocybe cf. subviscida]|uniref:NAD(P)-binding protein n=1 Tax=Psilocybe cf. subviscida TaxID=2480587 RepID=A0A8H5BNW4_9AGAR|nr:hypothetical protein D9619_004230 [Psilocybe cf. subviscida]